MIDIKLKQKYTFFGDRSPIKTMYRVRTGNSHGPNKSSLPALQPCHRAKAGAKVWVSKKHQHTPVTLHVDGLTGRKTFRRDNV